MTVESRRLAGVLLVLFPTVVLGGISLLRLLVDGSAGYVDNPIRQDLWRAGHAHAGVLLLLSLVMLRYVDDATLSSTAKSFVRHSAPAAAILMPVAYFLSVASPSSTQPNGLINLAYVAAAILALGLLTLGVGLLRRPRKINHSGAVSCGDDSAVRFG